jgi:predicted nucleic acid-binding protein
MNVVDSCGWIEYLIDGPNAAFFAAAIEDEEELVVPALSLLEVCRWVLRRSGKDGALRAVEAMSRGRAAALDAALAVEVARVSVERDLPLADSVILATAYSHGAVLWTQDEHFEGLPDVRYKAKVREAK